MRQEEAEKLVQQIHAQQKERVKATAERYRRSYRVRVELMQRDLHMDLELVEDWDLLQHAWEGL